MSTLAIIGICVGAFILWAAIGIVLAVYVHNEGSDNEDLFLGLTWPLWLPCLVVVGPPCLVLCGTFSGLKYCYHRLQDYSVRPDLPKATARKVA